MEISLLSAYPNIAAEWNYNKSSPLLPSEVKPKSDRKVWWICPYCSSKYVLPGKTDLATLYPEISSEWDYNMNGTLLPSEVLPKSNKYAWWICDLGHSWYAKINNRVTNNTGCPYCSGQLVIPGETDLFTLNPALASQWNYNKNKDLLPTMVTAFSHQKVWWVCSKGHVWKSTVNNRANGTGCPYCNQNRLTSSETSLAVINPILAKEWHPTKNGMLTANDVSAFDNHKYW